MSEPTEHRVSHHTLVEVLDKTAAPTEIERSDGYEGMESARANATLVDADEQAAASRAVRQEPAPAVKGRTVHEQVVTDLLNRSGARSRVKNPADAYELVLDVAVALRSILNDRAAQSTSSVPPTPEIRPGYVHVDDNGVAWQWRPGWYPITTLDGLDEATRAAVEAHTGPLTLPAAKAGRSNGATA